MCRADDWAAKRADAAAQKQLKAKSTRREVFKRAESYAKEYRAQVGAERALHTAARRAEYASSALGSSALHATYRSAAVMLQRGSGQQMRALAGRMVWCRCLCDRPVVSLRPLVLSRVVQRQRQGVGPRGSCRNHSCSALMSVCWQKDVLRLQMLATAVAASCGVLRRGVFSGKARLYLNQPSSAACRRRTRSGCGGRPSGAAASTSRMRRSSCS